MIRKFLERLGLLKPKKVMTMDQFFASPPDNRIPRRSTPKRPLPPCPPHAVFLGQVPPARNPTSPRTSVSHSEPARHTVSDPYPISTDAYIPMYVSSPPTPEPERFSAGGGGDFGGGGATDSWAAPAPSPASCDTSSSDTSSSSCSTD